jgi:hypothetical protein
MDGRSGIGCPGFWCVGESLSVGKTVGYCALAILVALYVVGEVRPSDCVCCLTSQRADSDTAHLRW